MGYSPILDYLLTTPYFFSIVAANICIYLCIHVQWLHWGLGEPMEGDDGRVRSVRVNSACSWSSQVRSWILSLDKWASDPYKTEYSFMVSSALWLIPPVLVWQSILYYLLSAYQVKQLPILMCANSAGKQMFWKCSCYL